MVFGVTFPRGSALTEKKNGHLSFTLPFPRARPFEDRNSGMYALSSSLTLPRAQPFEEKHLGRLFDKLSLSQGEVLRKVTNNIHRRSDVKRHLLTSRREFSLKH